MNQSILFPDRQHWDEELQAVVFPAQQAGALIECLVSADKLMQLSGQTIKDAQHAIELFDALRFELEDLAEEQIEDEAFNAQGQILLF